MIDHVIKKKRSLFPIAFACLSLFFGLVSFSTNNSEGITDEVMDQINQFRRSEGLAELIMNEKMNEIATEHSKDMAGGRAGFGHDGFSKRADMAYEKTGRIGAFAENVAYGNSVSEVISMWKNSAGHRRNMLGNYKYTGIGIAKNSKGVMYYTMIFLE